MNQQVVFCVIFHVFIWSSWTTVTMLLQNRAVIALGLRMCSTNVLKGPLMDTARPNSGKMIKVRFNEVLGLLAAVSSEYWSFL